MADIDYMKRALALALRARGETSPNPLVGAVIVKGSKIIAEGWHKRCGADHAEIVALKKSGSRARGAKLYVTLEPCSHFGRTPPCLDKILESGIREVIVGMKDPNPLNNGRSIRRLKQAGIITKVGILEEELSMMNEAFIKYMRTGLPFVTAKSAQTLDGKIAAANGQSQWITSPSSRDHARELRNDFDAIMVGINTVLSDDPRLNAAKKSKRIKKIIADSTLKIPLNARLFTGTRPEDIIVATTTLADKKKLIELKKKGVNVLVGPAHGNHVHLRWLFKELGKREITSVLIEGGARVIGRALKAGLVDKFLIFIAPKIMGDSAALSSVAGLSISHVNQAVKLRDLTLQPLNEDLLIEAYVHRDH